MWTRALLPNDLEFLNNACIKTPYMRFKTSKMDQIALQYWYNGFIRPLRVDGRGFPHWKPTLEKGSPDQKSKHRKCAEACNSYKIKKTYTRGTNISLKGGQRWIASVQPFPPLKQNQGLIEGAAKNLPNNPRQENGGTPLVFFQGNALGKSLPSHNALCSLLHVVHHLYL